MADPKNKWTQPAAPPPPMFFGKKERDLVKQVNDELAERVIGQTIGYYPISLEDSNFNDIYGEAIEKVSLPPVRVYAYVEVESEQTNERYGYEYESKLTVNFHRKRLTEDQNLFVRVGDFIQYGDQFYEIVRTYNDTRYYFGQVQHKFQISAECIKARKGSFSVVPTADRDVEVGAQELDDSTSPAPREAVVPPVDAEYVTVSLDRKLVNGRYLVAGDGIAITDGGRQGPLTIETVGLNAEGPTGSVQYQIGAGQFSGSSEFLFLTSSSTLAVDGVMSASSGITASSGVIEGDFQIKGTLIGGSPLKIAGAIEIHDTLNGGGVVASMGDVEGTGDNSLSSSCLKATDVTASYGLMTSLTASSYVSSSYYYGDGSYLTNIATGQGNIGSMQFLVSNDGDISGSSQVLYNYSNDVLTLNTGLVHNRTAVASNYTASVTDYILGITSVPVSIEFDATLFAEGQVIVVKDESGAVSETDKVTLVASGSQTVDGNASVEIDSPYGAVLLYSNGSNWFIY